MITAARRATRENTGDEEIAEGRFVQERAVSGPDPGLPNFRRAPHPAGTLTMRIEVTEIHK